MRLHDPETVPAWIPFPGCANGPFALNIQRDQALTSYGRDGIAGFGMAANASKKRVTAFGGWLLYLLNVAATRVMRSSCPGPIGPVDGRHYECLVHESPVEILQQSRAEAGGEQATYQPGQQLQLRVELLTSKGPRAVRIGGSVAWAGGDYFGLSFAKTSDVIVEALRRHDRLARTGLLVEPNRRLRG